MPIVRVYNDDSRPYSEKFRDEVITIPPKGYVDMEHHEAVMFMSQYTPVVKSGDGRVLNPKMLRLDGSTVVGPANKFEVCMSCKQEFKTVGELNAHIADSHSASMIDEEAKKAIGKHKTA